jgi:hypothetical protein
VFERSVLAVIVDPDDLVARAKEVRDEITADEPGRAGDQNLHVLLRRTVGASGA